MEESCAQNEVDLSLERIHGWQTPTKLLLKKKPTTGRCNLLPIVFATAIYLRGRNDYQTYNTSQDMHIANDLLASLAERSIGLSLYSTPKLVIPVSLLS